MPNSAEHDHIISSIYDRVEAIAELTAEVPELADRLHNYEAFLATAGLFSDTLEPFAEMALRHLAGCHRGIVEGVHDLLDAVRQAAYEEGFEYGANLPVDEEDEDDGDDPDCSI